MFHKLNQMTEVKTKLQSRYISQMACFASKLPSVISVKTDLKANIWYFFSCASDNKKSLQSLGNKNHHIHMVLKKCFGNFLFVIVKTVPIIYLQRFSLKLKCVFFVKNTFSCVNLICSDNYVKKKMS